MEIIAQLSSKERRQSHDTMTINGFGCICNSVLIHANTVLDKGLGCLRVCEVPCLIRIQESWF